MLKNIAQFYLTVIIFYDRREKNPVISSLTNYCFNLKFNSLFLSRCRKLRGRKPGMVYRLKFKVVGLRVAMTSY